jgi:hypothetical protein
MAPPLPPLDAATIEEPVMLTVETPIRESAPPSPVAVAPETVTFAKITLCAELTATAPPIADGPPAEVREMVEFTICTAAEAEVTKIAPPDPFEAADEIVTPERETNATPAAAQRAAPAVEVADTFAMPTDTRATLAVFETRNAAPHAGAAPLPNAGSGLAVDVKKPLTIELDALRFSAPSIARKAAG